MVKDFTRIQSTVGLCVVSLFQLAVHVSLLSKETAARWRPCSACTLWKQTNNTTGARPEDGDAKTPDGVGRAATRLSQQPQAS